MKNKQFSAVMLSLASIYTFLMLPLTPLWAQSFELPDVDLFAPIIKHEPASQTIKVDEPLTLKATVTDNVMVEAVSLYYRVEGAEKYSSIRMESLGEGSYSAAIPQEALTSPKIEYYIQASDKAGNKSLRGFSFEPLTMTVFVKKPPVIGKMAPPKDEVKIFTEKAVPGRKEPFALTTGKAEAPSMKKPWYKKWWVWTIALAVVGGAAAAGGGGGGGGGNTGAGAVTGSVEFSGSTP